MELKRPILQQDADEYSKERYQRWMRSDWKGVERVQHEHLQAEQRIVVVPELVVGQVHRRADSEAYYGAVADELGMRLWEQQNRKEVHCRPGVERGSEVELDKIVDDLDHSAHAEEQQRYGNAGGEHHSARAVERENHKTAVDWHRLVVAVERESHKTVVD